MSVETGTNEQRHTALDSVTAAAAMQVNYNLLTVNVFMAITGLYQLSRKIRVDYGEQLGLPPPVVEAAPVPAVKVGKHLDLTLK